MFLWHTIVRLWFQVPEPQCLIFRHSVESNFQFRVRSCHDLVYSRSITLTNWPGSIKLQLNIHIVLILTNRKYTNGLIEKYVTDKVWVKIRKSKLFNCFGILSNTLKSSLIFVESPNNTCNCANKQREEHNINHYRTINRETTDFQHWKWEIQIPSKPCK